MSLDERSRHELFVRLEDVLGTDAASTLMEHLPPVGWADVATKRDLDHLREVMETRFLAVDHRFDSIDHRFDALEGKLMAEINSVSGSVAALEGKLMAEIKAMGAGSLRANVALVLAIVSLVFAAVRFGH